MENKIIIRGAREHNLKNINLELPRNKLIVFTGLSGSGKSSLAFDTIFAEGQRRYIESLSTYARQFLGQMEKPDVDLIEGLSPAVAIDQKARSQNPRSTVGTVTEIYDYLRVLFARIGKPFCPKDGTEISKLSVDQIVDNIIREGQSLQDKGLSLQIFSPIVRGRKGEYHQLLRDLYQNGFQKARIDGKIRNLPASPSQGGKNKITLSRYKIHNIDLLIDELALTNLPNPPKEELQRLTEDVEQALSEGEGLVTVREKTYSKLLACPKCGFSFEEITPRLFSFNSPYGACESCHGIGAQLKVDEELLIPNKNKTIEEGAILPWNIKKSRYYGALLRAVTDYYNIPTDVPIRDIDSEDLKILLYGPDETDVIKVRYFRGGIPTVFYTRFEGIISNLERRYQQTESDLVREEISQYQRYITCQVCQGQRLRVEALSVKISNKNISQVTTFSIGQALRFFENLKLTDREKIIAERLLKEIQNRLKFMFDVGLNYLTLDRRAGTLSGGEAQRIRLASQIGSGLVGVLYVLDEPTIGLHLRDNKRLISTLKRLRDLGNTVLVVEHDEETIWSSDYIVDIGPGAGREGGQIVEAGSLEKLLENKESITAQYLRGDLEIPLPLQRRKVDNKKFLTIWQAAENNLKNITVHIPLSVFVGVTGVSGSGKSTLIHEILYKALSSRMHSSFEKPGKHRLIEGYQHLDKVILVDQSPIGRTPRSNPATYTGVFTEIRELFSKTPDAKTRGYSPGRFSFNVSGGRCENCSGDGQIKIEMHFLPDVYVPCEVCKGARFNRETLEVKYKGKNISEVLNMTVTEALEFFRPIPQISDKLQTILDVGLGYIQLGQPAPTLSGGEAQRVKLSAELARRQTGKTLYILDEPTTGLHFDDIKKLLNVLNRLVDSGNSVIVIEHHPDVIKTADYIIDLGPEGGEEGGKIVAEGTPEQIAKYDHSYTGQFLKKILEKGKVAALSKLS